MLPTEDGGAAADAAVITAFTKQKHIDYIVALDDVRKGDWVEGIVRVERERET